jgi:hypothetical protein
MGIYSGDTELASLFVGDTQIQNVYSGDDLVWEPSAGYDYPVPMTTDLWNSFNSLISQDAASGGIEADPEAGFPFGAQSNKAISVTPGFTYRFRADREAGSNTTLTWNFTVGSTVGGVDVADEAIDIGTGLTDYYIDFVPLVSPIYVSVRSNQNGGFGAGEIVFGPTTITRP